MWVVSWFWALIQVSQLILRIILLKHYMHYNWVVTVICKCINTPARRQYINAHFKMAVYHRKRVATIINFLSFISIDIKGLRSILVINLHWLWNLDINTNEWKEIDDCCYPFSVINSYIFQKGHLCTVSLLGY